MKKVFLLTAGFSVALFSIILSNSSYALNMDFLQDKDSVAKYQDYAAKGLSFIGAKDVSGDDIEVDGRVGHRRVYKYKDGYTPPSGPIVVVAPTFGAVQTAPVGVGASAGAGQNIQAQGQDQIQQQSQLGLLPQQNNVQSQLPAATGENGVPIVVKAPTFGGTANPSSGGLKGLVMDSGIVDSFKGSNLGGLTGALGTDE